MDIVGKDGRSADKHYILYLQQYLTKMPDGAPVAQWVKHWPTDIADQIRSLIEVKSSQL